DHFDLLLLAAGHPGDHLRHSSEQQSSCGRYRRRAGFVEEGQAVQHDRNHRRGCWLDMLYPVLPHRRNCSLQHFALTTSVFRAVAGCEVETSAPGLSVASSLRPASAGLKRPQQSQLKLQRANEPWRYSVPNAARKMTIL